jgi:hypothetical protein
MPNRFSSLSGYRITWSVNKRTVIIAIVFTVLCAVTSAVAWFSSRGAQPQHHDARPQASSSPSSTAVAPAPSAGTGSVPAPPQIADPVGYAKAAARMLWSYDTRDTSRDQQLAGMRAWMTTETKYTDWASVAGQVPDPLLWSRMADQDQHATATVTEGHYPDAFKQALAEDPSAITEAYVYVVTVNGTQRIAWTKGGSGAEERAVTLAVQCRPGHDCTLSGIAPSVTQ